MDTVSITKTKFSRAATPRSKGGCITCRNRRVKCDEGRPSCIRCVKAKQICGGYILLKGRLEKDDRDSLSCHTLIKPKTLPLLQAAASSPRYVTPSSIFLGESEIENRYFRYFWQSAATGLDGAWGFSLWNMLMLQACNQESFVRYGIIAIGALLKSHETAYSAGVHPRSVLIPDITKLHRDFAMVKYDTAVKLMQKAICPASTNPRQALLGCILVVCFEMLIGNSHVAIKHAQSGTIILKRWRSQMLALKERPSLLSPAPLTVEDEIVEAFRTLDVQTITLWNDRPAADEEEMINDHCATIAQPPACFVDPSIPNLREIRVYLNLIVRRVYYFITTTWRPSELMVATKKFDSEPPGDDSIITNMNILSTSTHVKLTDAIQATQMQLATEIANWMRAFAPLFKSLCTKREDNMARFSSVYNVAAMMQMQAVATVILTAGVVITNEMEYDKFNPQFCEIVDLATAVVRLRQRRKIDSPLTSGFWIDIGITPQLFVVVTRCRDPVTRRMAIKLLEEWYIEGNWDPRLIAQIGLFLMEVEEEGLEDVDLGTGKNFTIPERARAVVSRISDDSRKGRALIQCVVKSGGMDGGPIWREKYVEG